MDFYIHQIGNINSKETYDRLSLILNSKVIASRLFLKKMSMIQVTDNPAFKLNIPKGDEWMYYEEDIHENRVSLSDPQNRFIKAAIRRKDHQEITCFDYDYIGIAISRDITIVPQEETKGLAYGEVQVEEKIDATYIIGLIVPISKEELQKDEIKLCLDRIIEICEENNFSLDIYNYEGEKIFEIKKEKRR